MYRAFSTIIVLSALALLTSCGDQGGMNPEDLKAGTFEATVSGEANVTLRGCAAFVSEFGYFQLGFISTQSGVSGGLLTLVRGDGSVPSAGTYQIGEEAASASPRDFIGLFFQSTETFTSESGTLKITSSSGSTLQGSFNFTASNGVNKRVTVSGTFKAKSGTCI